MKKKKFKFKFYRVVVFHGSSNKNQNPHGAKLCLILKLPVALSAYFLKGVVPEWDLKDIYLGMMQFMVLQVIGLIIIIAFPKIVLWLPTLLYGQ